MAKAKEGIRLCPDGHYEMPLPLRNINVVLPNNRVLAVRRHMPLKKKFATDKNFRDHYIAFMESMLKSGYAGRSLLQVPTDAPSLVRGTFPIMVCSTQKSRTKYEMSSTVLCSLKESPSISIYCRDLTSPTICLASYADSVKKAPHSSVTLKQCSIKLE